MVHAVVSTLYGDATVRAFFFLVKVFLFALALLSLVFGLSFIFCNSLFFLSLSCFVTTLLAVRVVSNS